MEAPGLAVAVGVADLKKGAVSKCENVVSDTHIAVVALPKDSKVSVEELGIGVER